MSVLPVYNSLFPVVLHPPLPMVIPKRGSSFQAVTSPSHPSVRRPSNVLPVHVLFVSRPSHPPPSVVVVPEQLDGCALKVGEGVCHVRVLETGIPLHLVGEEKVFQGGSNLVVQLFVLRVWKVLVKDSLYERDIAHGSFLRYIFFLSVPLEMINTILSQSLQSLMGNERIYTHKKFYNQVCI